jgi:hypothetical protein
MQGDKASFGEPILVSSVVLDSSFNFVLRICSPTRPFIDILTFLVFLTRFFSHRGHRVHREKQFLLAFSL